MDSSASNVNGSFPQMSHEQNFKMEPRFRFMNVFTILNNGGEIKDLRERL